MTKAIYIEYTRIMVTETQTNIKKNRMDVTMDIDAVKYVRPVYVHKRNTDPLKRFEHAFTVARTYKKCGDNIMLPVPVKYVVHKPWQKIRGGRVRKSTYIGGIRVVGEKGVR